MLRRAAAACTGRFTPNAEMSWHGNQLETALASCLKLSSSFCSASEPDPESNPAPSEKVVKLADEIENLTVKEVVWLNKILKERMGISDSDLGMGMGMAAAPLASAAAPQATQEAAEPVEEKTAFDVVIEGFDTSAKIKIIKEVRALLPDLGLKEAKALVDKLPATVKTGIPKADAEEVQKKLAAVGAQVNLQ